jgi:uncharacterized protein (TIGR00369 family)
MATLGIEISRLSPGEIELTMPYAAAYTRQHGFVQAGIVATALDSDCGYAAFSLMPANAGVLTVEFKTSLLAPARGQRFLFQAQVVKPRENIDLLRGPGACRERPRRAATSGEYDGNPDGRLRPPGDHTLGCVC